MRERHVHLHAVRFRSDEAHQRFHVGILVERAEAVCDDVLALEALQLDHAGQQPRFEVLHLSGVGEVARKLRERAFDLAGPQAEIAALERRLSSVRAFRGTGAGRARPRARRDCPRRASGGRPRGRRGRSAPPSGAARGRTGREPQSGAAQADIVDPPAVSGSPSRVARTRRRRRFVGALVAVVVGPCDGDLVAGFRAFHPESQVNPRPDRSRGG